MAGALLQRRIPFAFVTGYDPATIPSRFAGVEQIVKPAQLGAIVDAAARPPPSQVCA